jgi:NADH-quinone oxidoreductase subunit L
VALAGIGMAAYFFLVNRRAADRAAARLSGVHRLLSNKYYVDDVYDAAIVQPIYIVSEDGLWKGVDVGVIDRTVNGVASAVAGSGEVLRRLQTGSVRAYAVSIFLGGVLILGYFLWL